MAHVIDRDELPHGRTAHTFEGYRYGDADVSFFLTDGLLGAAPSCTSIPTRRCS